MPYEHGSDGGHGTIKAGSTLHTNKAIDVTFNTAKAGATVTWTTAGKTCSNISCHYNSSAQWGGKLGCTGCHGGNAGSGTPITLDTHTPHMNQAGVIGTNYYCGDCHAPIEWA